MNRPELVDALQSVDKQTWANIEIVLVDASGKGLDRHKALTLNTPLREVGGDKPLNRPAAANLALQEARGELLMFLDEDDWIAPEHIDTLVRALQEQTTSLIAYSDTRIAHSDGSPAEFVFSTPFNAALLKRDNYIPIHSALFSRKLLDLGCKFDESLEIYEDWDFWLQCATHSPFLHIAEVSAYYRTGGTSGTAQSIQGNKYNPDTPAYKARIQIFNKWLPSIDSHQLNAMLGSLDQSDYVNKLTNEFEDLTNELENKESYLQTLEQNLEEKAELISTQRKSYKTLESGYKNLETEYRLLEAHAKSLEFSLNSVLNSIQWKAGSQLLRPFRFVRRIKQRLGLTITSTAVGASLYRALRGSHNNTAETETNASISPVDVKKSYSDEAHKALDAFLAAGRKLQFSMPASPQVSIVVILYNQAALSLLCFQSLLKSVDLPFELIVIDNASSDETSRLLALCDGIKLIQNPSNVGFVEAVNQGANIAQGKHLLLLNNDAILQPHALENAVATLESDDSIGAVGGKIILLDGTLQEAGSIIWNDASCLGYGRGRNPEDPEFMFQREVDYCSGAFLLIKRNLFEELNGLDMDYAPAYYEESDFCVRLKKQGYKVIYEPNSVLTHYEFASSGGYSNASKLQIAHQEIFKEKHKDFLQSRPAPDEKNILRARDSSHKPRLLLIDDRVPLLGLGAGYPRCRHLLQDLHALGYQVSFYPLRMPHESWQDTYATLPAEVEVMLHAGTEGLETFLRERKNYYQHIIVSRDHNMAFLNELLDNNPDLIGNSHLVYDAEAVAAAREVLKLRLTGNTLTDAQAQKMIEEEVALAKHAHSIICVSDREAELFTSAGHSTVHTLGHACLSRLTPSSYEDRKDFLFVGALQDNGSPNVDSLLWFESEVLPALRKRLGEGFRILVVGKNGASDLGKIQDSSFKFLGMQDDLTPFYDSCRVFVAPTRFAAGIPHKVHEAAAYGIPVVATELLREQLGWNNGVELLSASDAIEFAEHCANIYTQKDLWKTVRQNAAAAIVRDCHPDSFMMKLKEILPLAAHH